MAKLSTHVLDTAHGIAASNVAIRLYFLGAKRELIAALDSNADGRTEQALLDGAAMISGSYEMEFDVGDYFRSMGLALDKPAFLEVVVVRFTINADENFHVPLLVSPWSYSTYRGS